MHFLCGLFLVDPSLIYTYPPSRFPRREAPRRPLKGCRLEKPGEKASMDAASKEATSKEATSLGSPWAPTVQLCGSPGSLGAAPRRLQTRRRSSSHFPGEPRGGPPKMASKKRWETVDNGQAQLGSGHFSFGRFSVAFQPNLAPRPFQTGSGSKYGAERT